MPREDPITKDSLWLETGLCRKCGNKLAIVGILELVGATKVCVGRCVICGERFEQPTGPIDRNDPLLLQALQEAKPLKQRQRCGSRGDDNVQHQRAVKRWSLLDPIWQQCKKDGMTWDDITDTMNDMGLGYKIVASTLINRASDLRRTGAYKG